MACEPFYHWQDQDLIFQAKVIPRASQNAWLATADQGIRIRIKAPPVDGKANQALIAYLSKLFGVKKSHIEVLSGETGRNKRFKVCQPSQLPEIFSK